MIEAYQLTQSKQCHNPGFTISFSRLIIQTLTLFLFTSSKTKNVHIAKLGAKGIN